MPSDRRGCYTRLSGRRNYEQVLRRGKSLQHEWISLSILPNGTPETRLGCAVSRGVGGAVCRNRLKRWLREAFRRNRKRVPLGLDLIVRVRRFPAEANYQVIEEKFLSLCRRVQSDVG